MSEVESRETREPREGREHRGEYRDHREGREGRDRDGRETKESIEKKIRKLRKDFQKNVQPVLRRHNYHLTKGERSRIKKKKAIKRIQRRERRLLRG